MDYQAKLKKMGKYEEPKKDIVVEESKPIDWEQRRYEIAKAALVGSLAEPVKQGVEPLISPKKHAEYAVELADALIKKLKEQ